MKPNIRFQESSPSWGKIEWIFIGTKLTLKQKLIKFFTGFDPRFIDIKNKNTS
jgi:hypothetical protein